MPDTVFYHGSSSPRILDTYANRLLGIFILFSLQQNFTIKQLLSSTRATKYLGKLSRKNQKLKARGRENTTFLSVSQQMQEALFPPLEFYLHREIAPPCFGRCRVTCVQSSICLETAAAEGLGQRQWPCRAQGPSWPGPGARLCHCRGRVLPGQLLTDLRYQSQGNLDSVQIDQQDSSWPGEKQPSRPVVASFYFEPKGHQDPSDQKLVGGPRFKVIRQMGRQTHWV